MTEDLKLSNEMIEKEKGPVCSEINMILDNPETIAMDQTVRTLFNIKNPTDELVGGSVDSIKNLTREDVLNYYNKYYTPDNMNLVISGNVVPDEIIQTVAKNFTSKKQSGGNKFIEPMHAIQNTVRKDFISDKATGSAIVIGFEGPKNNNAKEKVLYDLAKVYIGTSEVGLVQSLKKLGTYAEISSEKISSNPYDPRMVYMAMNVSDVKTEDTLKTVFQTLNKIKPINKEYLKISKDRLKEAMNSALEHSEAVNEYIGKSLLSKDTEYITDYEKILDSITTEDVDDAVKRFFNPHKAAITVVHPQNSNSLSFKGKHIMPLDMSKVTTTKTENNYEVGFVDTKSGNSHFNVSLTTKIPYVKCPAAPELLDLIYTMGIDNVSENNWIKFKEKNNLNILASCDSTGISVLGKSTSDNSELMLKSSKALMLKPPINEENLAKAKIYLKDIMSREQDSAVSLYSDYQSKNNP